MLGNTAFVSTMIRTSTHLTSLRTVITVIFLEMTFPLKLTVGLLTIVLFPLSFKFSEVPFTVSKFVSKMSISMCFRDWHCARWASIVIFHEKFIMLLGLK